MASTYTTRIRLEKQGDGENANSWGLRLNQNVIDLVDEAVAGYKTIDVTGATSISLTTGNGTDDEARNFGLNFVGTLTADCTVNIPAVEKIYFVNNKTTGDYNVLMKPTGGTAVTVAQSMIAATTGTTIDTLNSFAQDSISGTVSISGDLNVTGTASITNVRSENVSATTKIHAPAASITNVSATTIKANTISCTTLSATNVRASNVTATNIRALSNVTATNIVATSITTTGLRASNIRAVTSIDTSRLEATSITTDTLVADTIVVSDNATCVDIANTLTTTDSLSRIMLLRYSQTGVSEVFDGAHYITFKGRSGNTQGSIQADGSGNVEYQTTSDERLKENIIDAPSQWETIKNVNVRSYNWKLTGVNNIGFIAQELNQQIPQCVSEGGEDIDKNPWSIDYGKLTPFLTKGLQEAIEEIEKLKERLSALEENN